jgi:hypothetical protein
VVELLHPPDSSKPMTSHDVHASFVLMVLMIARFPVGRAFPATAGLDELPYLRIAGDGVPL